MSALGGTNHRLKHSAGSNPRLKHSHTFVELEILDCSGAGFQPAMIYSQNSVVYKKYLKILSYKKRLRAAVVRGVACKAYLMARDWNAEIERHAKT